jgi:hypothetical protein
MILLNQYYDAKTDPLAPFMIDVIRDIMRECGDGLHLLCERYAGCEIVEGSGFLFWVDRFGFNVMGIRKESSTSESGQQQQRHWQEFRFPFSTEIDDPEMVRSSIKETVLSLVLSEAENYSEDSLLFKVSRGSKV